MFLFSIQQNLVEIANCQNCFIDVIALIGQVPAQFLPRSNGKHEYKQKYFQMLTNEQVQRFLFVD